MPEHTMQNFFNGGRAVERAWLAATSDKIAFQPLSISTFLFNRLTYEGNKAFSTNESNELMKMKKEFEELFSIEKHWGKIFLFRLFISDFTPKQSLRVPVEEVL